MHLLNILDDVAQIKQHQPGIDSYSSLCIRLLVLPPVRWLVHGAVEALCCQPELKNRRGFFLIHVLRVCVCVCVCMCVYVKMSLHHRVIIIDN